MSRFEAFAAFSPGAIGSIGYADQEIYLGLIVAGGAGLAMALPIAFVITGLLVILGLSYTQVIQEYPSGGGSYEVARKTLGTIPGLVTAAALIVLYLLNVAVSLTTGVDAIASTFPVLWEHKAILSLLLLLGMTALNLRGMRETGIIMALPVYLFVFSYFCMVGYGGFHLAVAGTPPPSILPAAVQPLTPTLMLLTFSAGCTALTGVAAISNGVPSFRSPETKNASQVMTVMVFIMGLLFLGSVAMIQLLAVVAGPQETVLSAFAHRIFGTGLGYLIIQSSTFLILGLGANTSFAALPTMMSVMARDNYLPKGLAKMNSREVLVNGIILLSGASALLIVAFSGNSHALVPLFAVGSVLTWTLSQIGMAIHWRRKRGNGWRRKALLNGLGAFATAVIFVVIGSLKFFEGAWIAVLLVPILVAIFLRVHKRHGECPVQGLP